MLSPEGQAIEALLRIVNKEQEEVDFLLNPAQRIIDQSISGRDLYPKARREGVSMYFLARNLIKCMGVKNTIAVVISHEAKATQRMLDRVNYFIQHIKCPAPVINTHNKNEITFPKTNSTFYIGTAGAKAFGRGDGITDLHCSEIAFWNDAKVLAGGLFQAVPRTGRISIESTGNGAGDFYHGMCMNAVRGNGRYKLHFLPWHKFPEYDYALTPDAAAAIMENLDDELNESQLVKDYQLSAGQILFRREKLEELEYDLNLFNQEYPTTLDDCFQAGGSGIFYRVMYVESPDWSRRDSHLWALSTHPRPGRSYVIGGDVSAGVYRDSSVLEVFDCETKEQVAEWISNRISPDVFAAHAAALGAQYNNAYMAIESNNHGIVTLSELKKLYPSTLIHRVPRSTNAKPDEIMRLVELGTRVTSKSKSFIIGRLRKELAAGAVIHSPILKSELSTFVEHENGSMGAQAGSFDDCVMAAAHAFYVFDRAAMIDRSDDSDYYRTKNLAKDPFMLSNIIDELTSSRRTALFKEDSL
jgi:hypothetical protein